MKKHLLPIIVLIIFPVLTGLFSQSSCLPDGIIFTSQAQIDSFPINYPGCTEIEGQLVISDTYDATNDITNVDSLYSLTMIGGGLAIGETLNGGSNFVLESLHGLENLTSLGGGLLIANSFALTSLEGLENLTSIEGSLNIIQVQGMTNLEGLDGLITINGSLFIWLTSLSSLSGLDALDYSTLTSVQMYENALSVCAIQPICDYLENGGSATIHSNAAGCNSQQEVEDACATVSVDDLISAEAIQLFPNPTTGILHVDIADLTEWTVQVRDATGRRIMPEQPITTGQLDLSALSPGSYFLELHNTHQRVVKKVVVKRK